jgi:hypothetical protein
MVSSWYIFAKAAAILLYWNVGLLVVAYLVLHYLTVLIHAIFEFMAFNLI